MRQQDLGFGLGLLLFLCDDLRRDVKQNRHILEERGGLNSLFCDLRWLMLIFGEIHKIIFLNALTFALGGV